MSEIRIDDRVEIWTGATGSYWGYVTAITDTTVSLDDMAPDGKPSEVAIGDIKRVVFHGRRPAGILVAGGDDLRLGPHGR